MDVKVIVATHKEFRMPDDPMYVPLEVGAYLNRNLPYLKDNTGDNISEKNPWYSELTGLYWAIHNLDCEYLGLCHYRRYLSLHKKNDKSLSNVLSSGEAEKLLKETDIILPKKRNYYIETIYDHYRKTMYVEPLDIAGEIIREEYPEYYPEFDRLKHKTSAHLFNMFIMKKELAEDYCNWLFDILFEVEKRMDIEKYDEFHSRFFGRISERMLDIYINTNHLPYREVNMIYTGEVNWVKKVYGFLMAKFFNRKYDKSF